MIGYKTGGSVAAPADIAKLKAYKLAAVITVYGYAQATSPKTDAALALARAKAIATALKKLAPKATIKFAGRGTVTNKLCATYVNKCVVVVGK